MVLHSNIFQKHLFDTEEGQDIGLSYLKERGFREDVIRKFQLGYNPAATGCFCKSSHWLHNIILEYLQKSGLVVCT